MSHKSLFTPSVISLAVAGALTGSMHVAAEEPTVIEEVVVVASGIRKSVIDSIDVKRNEKSFVEVVSAEDIGKLPDSSIADSIARLPGLAAQRLDGRASRVTIRGFGENESATTFNGREQVSIGDNRGVEFDLYPSEIMSGVVVYKTPDASIDAEGIAGVIDLRTIRPLDVDERKLQINMQYEKTGFDKLNSDVANDGLRGTVSYIDKFADDTIGVALAVQTMESPNQELRWNAWGWDGVKNLVDFPEWGGSVDTGSYDYTQDFRVLGGAKPFVRSSILDRDTVMGVLELAPDDNFHATFDALYVDFKDTKTLRGIEIPGVWAGGHTDVVNVQDGFVTEGVITNEAVVRNDFEYRAAKLRSFGANMEWVIDDSMTVEFDVSHSDVKREIYSMEVYAGTGRGAGVGATDTIAYTVADDLSGVTFNPSLDYSDFNLIKLGAALSWGNGNTVPGDGQDGFLNAPNIEDQMDTLKLAAEQALDGSIFSQVTYGVQYKSRSKQKDSEGYYLTLTSYPDDLAPVPEQYRLGTANLDFIGMGQMIAIDSEALVRDGYYTLTSESLTSNSHLSKSWLVEEDITSLFVQADIDTELNGVAITGNVGVRYVDSQQSSDGYGNYQDSDGLFQAVPTHVEHSYNHVLPSLNLNFGFTETDNVRFGVAKTISRPRMDQMNASMSVSYNPASTSGYYWNVGGGNTTVEPKEAVGVDIAYEKYFAEDGYVALAYFHKDISNWIFNGQAVIDIGTTTTPEGGSAVNSLAVVSGPVNGGGGILSGYEFSFSLPMRVLSDSLNNFGLMGSYTSLDSDMQDAGGNAYEIPGLSKEISTLTAYYDDGSLSARVSARKRGDFRGDIYVIGFNTEQYEMHGETLVDAQLGYDFSEMGVEGLSVFVQGQNLTNEPFITDFGGGAIRDYQNYGKTYLMGVSYEF
jgi:iron complex outermembrane receptor protein